MTSANRKVQMRLSRMPPFMKLMGSVRQTAPTIEFPIAAIVCEEDTFAAELGACSCCE